MILSGITLHILHFTAGVIDIEGGYKQDELHPTGEFVVGLGGCSDSKECGTPNNNRDCSASDDCHKDYSCSDKCHNDEIPFCNSDMCCSNHTGTEKSDCCGLSCKEKCKVMLRTDVKGALFIYCCDKILSVNEYTKLTGKKIPDKFIKIMTDLQGEVPPKGKYYDYCIKIQEEIAAALCGVCKSESCQTTKEFCSGPCPSGDKKCADCEANPSMCRKEKSNVCCSDNKVGCSMNQKCSDKCDCNNIEKNMIFGKQFKIKTASNISLVHDNEGNKIIREKDTNGKLVVTFKKCPQTGNFVAIIEDNYICFIDKRSCDVTISHKNGVELVVLKDFYNEEMTKSYTQKWQEDKAGSKEICDDKKDNVCSHKPKICPQTGANVYDEIQPGYVVKQRHDVYGMVTTEFSNI